MPLHVNYKNIPLWREKFLRDNPENPGEMVQDPWVFVVGIFCIHTGINKITIDNAPEFYKRCKLVEACVGPLMQGPDGKDVPIDFEVIERFIGVTTNTNPYTPAQFFKHLRNELADELVLRYEAMRKKKTSELIQKIESTA